MNIHLQNSIIDSLKISKGSVELDNLEEPFSIGFKSEFFDSDPLRYDIVFNIRIKHRQGIIFDIIYRSKFSTDSDINIDFHSSPFVFVNSPAIAYPFLRAYVANVTLLSGYDPMMIPTLNFQKLYNDNKNNG